MRLDAIAIGKNPPEDVKVVIEVATGGEPIKYEMDKEAGTLEVDRFLYTPMRNPGNYGFVPHTLSDDGDPIDVLVANARPIVPGAVSNVRHVGVLKMVHDGGKDEKIVAVLPPSSPSAMLMFTTTLICQRSPWSKSGTSSSTTKTWNPANG
jgi:inorganic pyrophosphatase